MQKSYPASKFLRTIRAQAPRILSPVRSLPANSLAKDYQVVDYIEATSGVYNLSKDSDLPSIAARFLNVDKSYAKPNWIGYIAISPDMGGKRVLLAYYYSGPLPTHPRYCTASLQYIRCEIYSFRQDNCSPRLVWVYRTLCRKQDFGWPELVFLLINTVLPRTGRQTETFPRSVIEADLEARFDSLLRSNQ